MGNRADSDSELALARTVAGETTPSEGDQQTPDAGAAIGRFSLLEELGRGGMGVVFAAHDPDLDRKVAIKVLRRAAYGGYSQEGARSRQLREAQAMARLSHPNVVTVYDVGTFRDSVFIAMELVDGSNLTSWLTAGSRRPVEILSVFCQAGRGLVAAHEAGLVHRDFKPDNVLVGRDGRVMVTDFGLVGVTAGAASGSESDSETDSAPPLTSTLTKTKGPVGTPAYMSPEQHEGAELDHRTDQFSFCVALYEALYGEHPFEAGNRRALVHAVRRGVVRPDPGDTGVPSRVRAALLRGLQVDPDHRFPSMTALLEALEAEPWLSARRASALAVVAIAVVAVLYGVTRSNAGSTARCGDAEASLIGVWDRPARDRMSHAFERSGRPHAPAALERAVESLDDYAHSWKRMYGEVCRATEVTGEQPAEVMHLRMACLAMRRTELRAVVHLLLAGDDEAIDHASDVVGGLVAVDRCADASTLASMPQPATDPAVRLTVDRLRTEIANADVLLKAGRYADSLRTIQAAEPRWKSIDYVPVRARALYTLGVAQQYNGLATDAERTLREAAQLAAQIGDDSLSAEAWMHLAWVVGYMQARPEEGLSLIEVSRAALARAGDDPSILAELHVIAGAVALNAERGDVAHQHLQAAIALQSVLGDHPMIGAARNNLGNVYLHERELDAAAREFEAALEISVSLLGDDHPSTRIPMTNLAGVYLLQGEAERGLKICRRATSLIDGLIDPGHPERFYLLSCEGDALVALGDMEEAIPLLERALTLEMPNPSAPWERAEAQVALARALWETGEDRRRALELARTARSALELGGSFTSVELDELDAWLAMHDPDRRRRR